MPQQNITTITGFGPLSDLPCLQLRCGQASAVISLYGGQLLSYQPTAGNEVLWLSDKANWHNGTAIRGGVPVCWPWFGPPACKINPDKTPLPNHGLVRNRLWRFTDSLVTATSSSLSLSITVNDIPAALWPANIQPKPVNLMLTLLLNDCELTIRLSCDTPLYQQGALHSYFRINNLQQTRVTGLSQHYFDKVSNAEHSTQADETGFSSETDRIYYKTGRQLQLISTREPLTIKQQGHDASVIWNPGQQKSRDLPDMADDGFNGFVCIETARLDLNKAADLALSQTLIPA
jgi:glucose-6-phosphate 1-epimerase